MPDKKPSQAPQPALQQADSGEARTARLAAIIRPLRTAIYEVDCMWLDFEGMMERWGRDYGGLELNPDFQRGHVWTAAQQRHFIENVLRGIVPTAGLFIQFNCPNWNELSKRADGDLPAGIQCIDGLQRITAVSEFMAGRVLPFGLSVYDLDESAFSTRRTQYRFRLAVHDFRWRADLLRHYIDLNAGGTPHSNEEIERVRGLLAQAPIAQ